MAWKDKSSATFSGSSGQMAVMGELLHRKCNAAIPLEEGEEVAARDQELAAFCGDFKLTEYINAWESLPPFKAPVGIDVDEDIVPELPQT